jgi:hypothetical protein
MEPNDEQGRTHDAEDHKAAGRLYRGHRKGDRDELRSPDMQWDAIARYAAAAGITVEFAEAEVDVSGSKTNRAILDGLIARVRAGELGGRRRQARAPLAPAAEGPCPGLRGHRGRARRRPSQASS